MVTDRLNELSKLEDTLLPNLFENVNNYLEALSNLRGQRNCRRKNRLWSPARLHLDSLRGNLAVESLFTCLRQVRRDLATVEDSCQEAQDFMVDNILYFDNSVREDQRTATQILVHKHEILENDNNKLNKLLFNEEITQITHKIKIELLEKFNNQYQQITDSISIDQDGMPQMGTTFTDLLVNPITDLKNHIKGLEISFESDHVSGAIWRTFDELIKSNQKLENVLKVLPLMSQLRKSVQLLKR